MEESTRTAGVRLLDLPYRVDTVYTYFIPDTIEKISKGDFVTVPFGASNRRMTALVTETGYRGDVSDLKPVAGLLSPALSLSPEMLALAEFISERTLCSAGDAVKRLIPAEAFESSEECYSVSPDFDASSLNKKCRIVFETVKEHGKITEKELSVLYSTDTGRLIKALCKAGAFITETKITDRSRGASEKIIYPRPDADESELLAPRTTSVQIALYKRISEAGEIPQSSLLAMGYTAAQIKALEKKKLIVTEIREKLRIPYSSVPDCGKETVLSKEQSDAKNELSRLLDGKPHGALLYGVTGSGKTSVILSLCEDVVSSGGTAIVLVPEIALTWQSVRSFSARFGKRLAVIHSALSSGERYDAYRRIKRGDISVVLGTRSAIFAPLEKIALIVIDEEQEHTYKSDTTPKFSARYAARFRCEKNGALMLLSSATPSVETFYRASKGLYSLVRLDKRYGDAVLPRVTVANMRDDGPEGFCIIGKKLSEALIRTVQNGHQAMLFLNRRGYNSFLICRSCGKVALCPHCSVALTYHKGLNECGLLICHYCGFRIPPPSVCPSCQSGHIGYMGFGTQAAEEAVKTLIPEARVLRMDADTTQSKYSRDKIIEDFSKGEADVLVGTQMITKGHNFSNVTLAAVISADSSLYSDDFRASERTFSTITQLVGRSGRGNVPGEAIIQTYSPESDIIRFGASQNYDAFFKNEIALRKAFTFPPFCDIAVILSSSSGEKTLGNFSAMLALELKKLSEDKYSDVPLSVFGPFEAPIYKINDKFRTRIVIKFKNNSRSRELLSELMREAEFRAGKMVSVSIDINPTSY